MPNPRPEYIRSHYAKFEYRIPMRDGTRLFTSVYVPNQANFGHKFPFLLSRTPYSVAPYGLDQYSGYIGPDEEFEKEGFIFVKQDVRGRWMSEGEFVNMRPNGQGGCDESTDTYDTIDWLVEHVPDNNGRVGMTGISYPGFYSIVGAINSHPALKAISPQAAIADWWQGDDMHRHGAFCLQMTYTFFTFFSRPRPVPIDEEPKEAKLQDYGTTDPFEYFMELGPLRRAAEKFGFANAHWAEVAAHPNYDDYWRSRNLLPHLKNVNCAAMIVGGWFDTEDFYGPLHIYQTLRKSPNGGRAGDSPSGGAIGKSPNGGRAGDSPSPAYPLSLVIGPWNHGGWRGDGDTLGDVSFGFKTGKTFQEAELAFFKHYLKDGADPSLPGAWVFETGANRWRSFPSWPPAQAQPRKFYLGAQGTLGNLDGEGFEEYVSDPAKPVPYSQQSEAMMGWSRYTTQDERFSGRRPDVLVYQGATLREPLTVAGPLVADLWVSTSGTDSDWVVKLIDVNPGKTPDGKNAHRQTLVRAEPMRGRFRDDPTHPQPFEPGKKTHIHFVINDVFHTFQRNHRMMVQVQSSWFPFIDRNPQKYVANIFEARPEDFIKATQRVYHSSSLSLPILPGPDQ